MEAMRHDIFACPYCKSKVKLKNKSLVCKCGKKFPVENKIPIFTGTGTKRLFYENRYGSGYEEGSLDENDRIKLENSLDHICKKTKPKFENVLDIGCNPAMTRVLAEKTGSRTIGVSITTKGMYPEGEWAVCDVEIGLPFVDDSFGLVFCGELIEHTFNTDYFIEEIHRVIKTGGYLILITPNLASFWNRFFLLAGYQPHQLGVSMKKSYGNPFLKWDRFWGHTKVFTCKSLQEFIRDNGFEIIKIYGEFIRNPYDRALKRFVRKSLAKFPSLSEDLVCICRKSGKG